jgi:hypothetical protein
MRRPPENLDAWAAHQCGLWQLSKFSAPKTPSPVSSFSRRSTSIRAWQRLFRTFRGPPVTFQMSGFNQPEILAETEEWLEQLARQAVALDAADAEARMGTRITIGDVLSYLASGMTSRKFLRISPTDKGGHPRLSGVCRQA